MAIIALKAWYLGDYEPIATLEQRPPDLRLSRNSLLRSALRADFLDDSSQVRETEWFTRYLAGEAVEFYIEGSGGYGVANIDLISHEIYFTKLEVLAQLEPIVYYCPQVEYPAGQELVTNALTNVFQQLQKKSRLPLTLVTSPRLKPEITRLSSNQLRQIKRSLLFIVDGTPIAQAPSNSQYSSAQLEDNPSNFRGSLFDNLSNPPETIPISSQLVPSPQACLELGFALQSKRSDQILLLRLDRPDLQGNYPFDLPSPQQLSCSSLELENSLPTVIESLLQKYNLFP
jgi:hypothetical protein